MPIADTQQLTGTETILAITHGRPAPNNIQSNKLSVSLYVIEVEELLLEENEPIIHKSNKIIPMTVKAE